MRLKQSCERLANPGLEAHHQEALHELLATVNMLAGKSNWPMYAEAVIFESLHQQVHENLLVVEPAPVSASTQFPENYPKLYFWNIVEELYWNNQRQAIDPLYKSVRCIYVAGGRAACHQAQEQLNHPNQHSRLPSIVTSDDNQEAYIAGNIGGFMAAIQQTPPSVLQSYRSLQEAQAITSIIQAERAYF